MKQQISRRALLTGVIVIFVAALALSFLASSGSGVAQAQPRVAPVPASWEYRIDSSDTTSASAQQLNISGVAAKVQALGASKYRLVMSGNQGTAQIRQALYSPLVAGFIGGAADIEINMPVSNLKNITVDVESNLTTGYSWTVVAGAGFTQVGQPTFTQSAGVGATSVQTLVLQPKALGNGSIKLAYRRPFGPAETATRFLRITLAAQAAAIDLSDPAPKVIAINEPVVGSVDPQDPASELPSNPSLPAAYDARTAGLVPAVRNQGQYGSCWAFSTVGAMEIAIKKASGPLTDLSEQFLVSCNKDGWGNGGYTAHKYHFNTLGINQTAVGAVLESAKPYIAAKGTCSVAYAHPYKLSSWGFLLGSEFTKPTVAQIKTAIYTYGSVAATVCVDYGFNYYTGGVYSPTTNGCYGDINHAIVLVGWNDATSSWILRNSWGPSWGENGYMRIRYDSAYTNSHVGARASWVKYGNATTTKPKAGLWNNGRWNSFYVTPNQASVSRFSIVVKASCGTWKITRKASFPSAIVGNKFAFTGTFHANGTFSTTLKASGKTGLTNFPLCGHTVSTANTSWTSTWKNSSQAVYTAVQDTVPVIAEPALPGAAGITVEAVAP